MLGLWKDWKTVLPSLNSKKLSTAHVAELHVSTSSFLRALAVRTMGCIRVDKITEYLCEPLRNCLKDEDPYVRKTAAVTVAKLYDISPEMSQEQVPGRQIVACVQALFF